VVSFDCQDAILADQVAGLFRDGLFEATAYDKDSSQEILDIVFKWQEKLLSKIGTRFIYAADEFFLNAGIDIPDDEYYEGYYQIENGVGLIRSMEEEFCDALCDKPSGERKVTLVTGVAAYDSILKLAKYATDKYPEIKIQVKCIKNEFFGEKITVSGLIVGKDIINQLKGEKIYKKVLIPSVMLKHETDLFLDDVTVSDIEKELSCKIEVTDCTGYDLWKKIIK
jgi:NifB/MoaA-like Fe-S oxidoreductase